MSVPLSFGELPGVGLVVVEVLSKPYFSVATIDEPLTLKAPRFPLSAAAFNVDIAYSSVTYSLNVITKVTITLPCLEFEQRKYIAFY